MRGLAALLVLPLTVALLPLGCRQVLGVEDRSEGTPLPLVGECGGYNYPNGECAACMDAKCCDELTACEDSPGCDAEFSCSLQCAGDDAECLAACFNYAGAGVRLPVVTCRTTHCPEQCHATCGDRADGTAGCEQCMHAKCCQELRDCSLNASCYEGDDGDALISCQANACGPECATASWECLDVARAWLKPSATGTVSFTIRLYDFTTREPWVGLELRACAPTDFSCDNPLSSGTTGADGRAVLDVPLGTRGFDGYLEVVSDPGSDNPAYPGIISISTPPIVEEGAQSDFPWPTVAEFAALAGILGVVPDPARGHVALNARDCYSTDAPGVSFSMSDDDALIVPFYFGQQFPSLDGTATTEPLALGGFANVPSGIQVVRGAVVGRGDTFGEVSLLVRPGTLTLSFVLPGP